MHSFFFFRSEKKDGVTDHYFQMYISYNINLTRSSVTHSLMQAWLEFPDEHLPQGCHSIKYGLGFLPGHYSQKENPNLFDIIQRKFPQPVGDGKYFSPVGHTEEILRACIHHSTRAASGMELLVWVIQLFHGSWRPQWKVNY